MIIKMVKTLFMRLLETIDQSKSDKFNVFSTHVL